MTVVRVEGLRALDAALGELKKSTARGVLQRVGRKALAPVAARMGALAPDDPRSGPPDLHRSMVVGTRLTRRQARLARKEGKSFVEVYAGAAAEVNDYAHLIEFGTSEIAPQPFARPAWEQTKAGALETVKRELGGEIERTAKRVAARAARG